VRFSPYAAPIHLRLLIRGIRPGFAAGVRKEQIRPYMVLRRNPMIKF